MIVSAAIGTTALPQSVQNVHFVDNWARKTDEIWEIQQDVDIKLQIWVSILEASVLWMGNQIKSLQLQQGLSVTIIWFSFVSSHYHLTKAFIFEEWSNIIPKEQSIKILYIEIDI